MSGLTKPCRVGRNERPTASGRACMRCRQKKKRCDQRLPRCRLCELAGVECLGYDAAAVRQVPRSYIRDLENRVAFLESKLREHNIECNEGVDAPEHALTPAPAPAPTESASNDEASSQSPGCPARVAQHLNSDTQVADQVTVEAARTAAESVANLSPRQPGSEATFSRVFLTNILSTMAKPQLLRNAPSESISALPDEEAPFSQIIGELDNANATTLPSRETANNLVKVYLHFTNLGMPLLHEGMLQQKLDILYSMPSKIDITNTHTTTECRIAIFFVLEVFAIALLVVQQREPSGKWLADRYHWTALSALSEAGLPSNGEGVQVLLLIGLHAYHHPTVWSVWKIVGAAMRLAVELGLHQDPPSTKLNALELDTMRRTFWVAYAMDRNLSAALSLPSCISDGAITAKFPSEAKDELITPTFEIGSLDEDQVCASKQITLHLFRYRQIQSELRRALHEDPFMLTEHFTLREWQQRMHQKIEGWYQTAPRGNHFTTMERDVVETFEVTYNTALFNLYRPTPNIPHPSGQQLCIVAQAAIKMIHLYRQFFCQQKLTIYWQAVENLSSAGLVLLLGYVNSAEVRDLITLSTLNSMIHECSSALWGMVEHFPSLKGKRDAFDAASRKVLADLDEGREIFEGNIEPSNRDGNSWIDYANMSLQNDTVESGQA